MRWILHIDADYYYANCEIFRHPEVRGLPVAVGGDVEERHGIILTANPLAKSFGVKTGMALWEAYQKCRNLLIFPPDYDEYQRVSKYIREIVSDYTSTYEGFGLDELWADVTGSIGLLGNPEQLAKKIQWRIWNELGITASVGISFNKITAKLASDVNKPCGICYIPPEQYEEIVYPLPVSDLLMVGRKYTEKLKKYAIYTIGDLAQAQRSSLRSWFGVYGEMLSVFARGEDKTPVSEFDALSTIKSIGNSITTPRDLMTNDDVNLILYKLAESVARRMREQGFKGRVVCIWVRSSGLFGFSRQHKTERFTNIAQEIAEEAMWLFVKNYYWREPVRSIGISVKDFEHEDICTQLGFFRDEKKRAKVEQLERNVDEMRFRYGPFCIQRAVMLTDPHLSGFDPYTQHTIHPVSFLG